MSSLVALIARQRPDRCHAQTRSGPRQVHRHPYTFRLCASRVNWRADSILLVLAFVHVSTSTVTTAAGHGAYRRRAPQHVGDVQDGATVRQLRQFTSEPPGVGSARRLRRHRHTRCRQPRRARPRHQLRHHALHLCPGQCTRLRRLAPHDPLQFCPYSPPLNCRGGSRQRVSPASIAPSLIPRV